MAQEEIKAVAVQAFAGCDGVYDFKPSVPTSLQKL